MNRIESFFDKIMPTIQKISDNKYLQGISKGMVGTLTTTIVGSLAVLILVLPVDAIKSFVATSGISSILLTVNTFTLGCLAIYVSFLVGKSIFEEFAPNEDGSKAGILSIMCFFILTPLSSFDGTSALTFEWLGAQGVFTAMITGIITGRIMALFITRGWSVKLPDSVPPMVKNSFSSLIPGIVLAIFFSILTAIVSNSSFGSVHQMIFTLIQQPLKNVGGNIISIILIATLGQLLWFFGIHGSAITTPLIQPILMAMDVENLQAAANGLPLPNEVGYAFYITYTVCATAIGLTVLMLFAKSERFKALGKITFPAAIFGISEPLVFGTPLVLNFKLAIPFIFNNAIVLAVAYIFTHLKIVPPLIGASPIFGMPIGFHAAIQGSWRIIVMQLATQIIGMGIWYPFFKQVDKEAYKNEQSNLREISDTNGNV